MYPLLLAWNFRPTVCAFVVPLSADPVGVPFCQMLHGHVGPTVVKLHEYGLLIGVPEAFCAPDTVAVYVTPAASGLAGVNVATVSALLKLTVPATLFPPESFTVNDTVPGVTAWENVAAGATEARSEEHTSELQSHVNLVCRLLLEKKKKHKSQHQRAKTKKKKQ